MPRYFTLTDDRGVHGGGGHRWAGVAALAALTGCVEEPAGSSDTAEAPAPIEVEAVTPLPVSPCLGAPGWTERPGCTRDGFVYARGEAPLGLNPSLGRSRAATQARWALAELTAGVEAGRARLEGAEVPQVYVCDGTAYALARVRAPAAPTVSICDDSVLEDVVPPEGCPAWAHGQAWYEAGGIVGVALVDGIRNPSLARSSALSRARHAASEVLEVRLSKRGDDVQTFTPGRVLTTKEHRVARCGDATWGHVVVEIPAAP